MGNSSGTYRTSPQNAMKAFDKLPASARAALANAAYCWAPQPFLTQFERKGRWKTGKELAAYINQIDQTEVGKLACRAYGASHPQASPLPRIKGARRQ